MIDRLNARKSSEKDIYYEIYALSSWFYLLVGGALLIMFLIEARWFSMMTSIAFGIPTVFMSGGALFLVTYNIRLRICVSEDQLDVSRGTYPSSLSGLNVPLGNISSIKRVDSKPISGWALTVPLEVKLKNCTGSGMIFEQYLSFSEYHEDILISHGTEGEQEFRLRLEYPEEAMTYFRRTIEDPSVFLDEAG